MELAPVTRENFKDVLALCVSPAQEAWVGTPAEALAHKLFNPDEQPVALMACASLVGFAMYRSDGAVFHITRLMIDCAHQGRGHGGRALDALIECARKTPGVAQLALSVHIDARDAQRLYRSRGFALTARAGSDHLDGWRAV